MAEKASKSAKQTAPAEKPTAAAAAPAKKSNKALWIVIGLIVFFVVVVPILLLTAGAIWFKNVGERKLAENTVEGIVERASGGDVDIDTKDGSVSVKTEDGDGSFSIGGNQKLPDDFPKNEIPYLKEESVSSTLSSTSEGKKSWWVTTQVNNSYDEAKGYFESNIAEPAYSDITNYSFGESTTFNATGSDYELSVTVSSNDGKTSVSYVVREK